MPAELPPGVEFAGNLIRVAGEKAGEYDIKQGSLALTGENAAKYTLVFIGAKLTIYEKGVVTIIANNKSKFEDEPQDPELDYYVAPSAESLRLSFGITIVGALERGAGTAPGDYTISQGTLHLEGPDAGDWRIDFTPGVFHIAKAGEILVKAISFEKEYGEADPIFTYVLSPAALPAGLSLTGNLSREAGEVAGDYYIKPGSLALSGNATDQKPYHLKFDELTPGSGNLAKLTIKKKTVTVTATSFTRVFNSEFPDFTFTNDLGLPDSAFTGALKCEAATMANVGVFAIKQGTLALTTATDGSGGKYIENYNLSFVNGTLNITDNNIIHVSANPQTKFYGDADPVLSYTPAEALPAGLFFTGTPTRDPGENVKAGGYAIRQGNLALDGTNAQHYTIAFTNSTLTINQKALNVVPSTGQSKIYGTSDPANLTFSTSPTVDIASAFGDTKLNRAPGENAGNYLIKADNLVLQGSYATNYYIDFDDTKTFAITKCPVVITIFHTSKVRDDDDPEFDFAVTPSNLMTDHPTDWKTVVFGGTKPSREPGEGEGTYAITGENIELTLEYAANYEITTVQEATLRITPPGPVNISDPVTFVKPIIQDLHDNHATAGATFRKADGPPPKPDPQTGDLPAYIEGIKYLGSFSFWYDNRDNTVYYYYGGPVYLYGDCHNLFENCPKYTTMDMTGFNTQYVTNMYQMFYRCFNVEHLDLSGWSFDNVYDMGNMFDRCEKLETISFSPGGVDMSKVKNMGWIFAHNFYMTPTKLRAIIAQWKVKIDPNGTDEDSNINPLFVNQYSNATSGGERTEAGANRILSNDLIQNNPSPRYATGGVTPPPSVAFKNDTDAYVTKDGVTFYLGTQLNKVLGQRLNKRTEAQRRVDHPDYAP
ncbi:MAG: BspA family leucine-rich repeat surface protein [Spirochaetia bacterium]|nr:BspA family leucine-rich repeat surface protein [Spirochaetia bacterium]